MLQPNTLVRIIDLGTYDEIEPDTAINGGVWLAVMALGACCWVAIIKASLLGVATWESFKITH